MKIVSFYGKQILLFNFVGFITFFLYLTKTHNKKINLNYQSFLPKTISGDRKAVHLEINEMEILSYPDKYEKVQFGYSEAFIFQNICIEMDKNNRQYIAIYNSKHEYLINFNEIEILLSSQSINMTEYKYHKNFNMFFVRGTRFITFPVNMHHFYKDLAVDLFSVIQRLPNSETSKNW